jgi:hypothetical protein
VPGQYMPYTVQPEQGLAGLSETDIYEQISQLATRPAAPQLLRASTPELYSREVRGRARQEGVTEAKIKLARAVERVQSLRYRRWRRPGRQSEVESGEGEVLDEEGSSAHELAACIQAGRERVRERAGRLQEVIVREDDRLREAARQRRRAEAEERELVKREERERAEAEGREAVRRAARWREAERREAERRSAI